MRTPARDATLDLRVTPHQKDLIRRAAAIRGQTMTEFVLAAVEPVATALVERQEAIELTQTAWRAFTQMVDGNVPATPVARCEAAAFAAEMAVNRGRAGGR
jgi:uncharacterized protein (DUF1778 family)